MITAKIVELEAYQKKTYVIEVSQNLFLPCKIHEGKTNRKNYVFDGLEKNIILLILLLS